MCVNFILNMKHHNNNELLKNFLNENKRYLSLDDFNKVFSEADQEYKKNYIYNFKTNLLNGNIRDGQISKFRNEILKLCSIVSERLEEEKEILERIKNLQEINN